MHRTLFLFIVILARPAAPALGSELNGDKIQQLIGGKRIYLKTPLGGEFPMNYRSNGTVDADGKANGLGRFVKPSDSGRWWISGNQLCQKWTSWYQGRTFCFVLIDKGNGRLVWKRNDGATGKARLGDSL